MKTRMLLLTTALALSAAAPAAWALETEWVATGTVYDGYDYTGVFGPAAAGLDGDSFTADFYIDTSKGHENGGVGFDQVYGGSAYAASTPVSATLEINGITQIFDGLYNGLAAVQATLTYGDEGFLESDVTDDVNNRNYLYAEISGVVGEFPSIIGQAFSVDNYGNGYQGGFQLYDDANGTPKADGDLVVNNIYSPGVISAAPEPSVWALLIAGVGVVGATLRLERRRDWALA